MLGRKRWAKGVICVEGCQSEVKKGPKITHVARMNKDLVSDEFKNQTEMFKIRVKRMNRFEHKVASMTKDLVMSINGLYSGR